MEGNINAQPKYILCTKSKSRHRKAIAVCHQCDDRQSCREYQQVQEARPVEQIQKPQAGEQVREARPVEQIQEPQPGEQIREARPVQQDKETRQPELVQAMDTLVLAFNKKNIRPKDVKTLKSALEALSALFKES